jgi:acetyl/propionyl-CoA carboxylase alpha subunit
MIAKVVAWGQTREEAIGELARALAETRIGPCVTNLAFLEHVLADEGFRKGEYDTAFAEALARRA